MHLAEVVRSRGGAELLPAAASAGTFFDVVGFAPNGSAFAGPSRRRRILFLDQLPHLFGGPVRQLGICGPGAGELGGDVGGAVGQVGEEVGVRAVAAVVGAAQAAASGRGPHSPGR